MGFGSGFCSFFLLSYTIIRAASSAQIQVPEDVFLAPQPMVLCLWSGDLTQEQISLWPSWYLIYPDVPETFQCSLALQDVPSAWPPAASLDVRRMCKMALTLSPSPPQGPVLYEWPPVLVWNFRILEAVPLASFFRLQDSV